MIIIKHKNPKKYECPVHGIIEERETFYLSLYVIEEGTVKTENKCFKCLVIVFNEAFPKLKEIE